MFPFDVILFDVGGVLLTNGWDHVERARVVSQFGLDVDEFEARHPAPYVEWERGAIPIKDYLDATIFYQPRSFSQDDFYQVMLAQSRVLDDGALGILHQVAASHKCLVGALNNEARETNEYRFEKFGLRSLFSVALSSCYLGLRKPAPAIFSRALDILGRPAERTLFIDDRAENVAGALSVGIKAVQFTGAEALQGELVNLGVI
jgi:putative hydrolase of the HAD superfamily